MYSEKVIRPAYVFDSCIAHKLTSLDYVHKLY